MGSRHRLFRSFLPLRQIALAATITALALIALSFSRVLVAEYRLDLQKHALQNDVARLRDQNQQLRSEIEYLRTDAAIEKLAREELGWTKPGETAVVVLAVTPPTPPIEPLQPSRPSTREASLQTWWSVVLKRLSLDR